MAQVGVIGMLSHHAGGFGVREIAHRMRVSSAAVSQVVDRLVQGGFVSRVESPTDRRARLITLSDKGRALFSARSERPLRWITQVADALTDAEATVVLSALTILNRIESALDEGGVGSPQDEHAARRPDGAGAEPSGESSADGTALDGGKR